MKGEEVLLSTYFTYDACFDYARHVKVGLLFCLPKPRNSKGNISPYFSKEHMIDGAVCSMETAICLQVLVVFVQLM